MGNVITCIAVLKAKPEKTETLRKELLGMIEPTRKEPGCLEYVLFESTEEQGAFYMREAFKSKEAFEEHIATTHFQELSKKMDDILKEPINIIKLKKIST